MEMVSRKRKHFGIDNNDYKRLKISSFSENQNKKITMQADLLFESIKKNSIYTAKELKLNTNFLSEAHLTNPFHPLTQTTCVDVSKKLLADFASVQLNTPIKIEPEIKTIPAKINDKPAEDLPDNKENKEIANSSAPQGINAIQEVTQTSCISKLEDAQFNNVDTSILMKNNENNNIIYQEKEIQCDIDGVEEQKHNELSLKEINEAEAEIKMLNESIAEISSNIEQTKKKSLNYQEFIAISELARKSCIEHLHKLKGHIRVFCRVKPPAQNPSSLITFPEQSINAKDFYNINISGESFLFNKIFTSQSTQESIFEEINPFILSAIDGEKVSIFAYGQTGSGKTYTMLGPPGYKFLKDNSITAASGLLPRAGELIFKEKDRRLPIGYKIEVVFSAIEIYNETIRDLITNEGNMQLVGINDISIKNLTTKYIYTLPELIDLVEQSISNRSIGKTVHNDQSSRSHCIMQFIIKSEYKGKPTNGMLNIIDLAGSEKANTNTLANKSKEEQEEMKKVQTEANFINKSLTALGRVLMILSEEKGKIPTYRDSKLTRILQSSLHLDAKTLMFVNISSENSDLANSKNSLRFAQTAAMY